MNLFIDTNIYLTFFHFSSDEIEELKKLGVAIDSRKIKLYVTEQVISEFKRNRESKIADALKRFEGQSMPSSFPQICKGYAEYEALRKAVRDFESSKGELLRKLQNDIENSTLGADDLIANLFGKATVVPNDIDLLNRARLRSDLGNPPGKDGSYGDAVNWEALLGAVPISEDLYVVSGDKDYVSQIDENQLSKYLMDEWVGRKSSDIFFYPRLSDFFADKFPEINLASELEKELTISDLAGATNFRVVHLTVRKLFRMSDFSDKQVNDIVEIYLDNPQVYRIGTDHDIKRFVRNLLKGRESIIPLSKQKELDAVLEGVPYIDEHGIPMLKA